MDEINSPAGDIPEPEADRDEPDPATDGGGEPPEPPGTDDGVWVSL